MNRYLTRQELYQLVWSEPISVIAKRMGVSDVGFAKACRRARVPIPERGYWAKRKAGKPVIQPALPPRMLGMSDGTDVQVNSSTDPAQISEGGFTLTQPEFSEDISQLTARVRGMVGKVTVPKNLARPHAIIARLLEEDERRREAQRNSSYAYSWNNPLFDSPIERRRLRILNAIFLALARCNTRPYMQGRELKELQVQVGHQRISYVLERVPSRVRAPKGEGADAEKRRPERLRLRLLSSDRRSTGAQSWEDKEGAVLEDQIADIVTSLIVAGELQYRDLLQQHYEWLVQQQRREEEEATRRKQEEAARQERERLVKEQQNRIDRLLGEAMALRQAADIRVYVETVIARMKCENDPVKLEMLHGWASWAMAEADRIDPIKSERFLLEIPSLVNDRK